MGTFWAHEILKVDFMVLEMRGADIENEDAVQHPRFLCTLLFEEAYIERDVFLSFTFSMLFEIRLLIFAVLTDGEYNANRAD